MRGRTAVIAGALAAAVSIGAKAAQAEPVRVLLIRPAGDDHKAAGEGNGSTFSRFASEALVRIQGELRADGFDVELVSPSASASEEQTLANAEGRPAAVVGLSLDPRTRSAELWIVDRVTGTRVTRALEMADEPPNRVAQVLAVRSVEFLRARLLEVLVRERRLQAPPARAVTPPVERPAAAPARAVWGLEAGASVLTSPGEVGPAALFTARGRREVVAGLDARLTFVALGTQPTVRGPQGTSATVGQALGLAELVWAPWPALTVRPVFALGAGAFWVSASTGPAAGASIPQRGAWAFAADGGGGLEVPIAPGLALSFEGNALLTLPYPVLRLVKGGASNTARDGSPGVLGSLTLVGRL